MQRRLLALIAAAGLAACAENQPEQTAPTAQTSAPAVTMSGMPPGMDAAATLADFAPRAAAANLYEIQAGRIAGAKGVSPDVRAFGELMVADHTRAFEALQAAIDRSGRPVNPPTTLAADKQALIDALDAAPAGAFDRIFLDQQVEVHSQTLTMLQAYAADGETQAVKAYAAEAAPVVQGHLERARSMRAAMGD